MYIEDYLHKAVEVLQILIVDNVVHCSVQKLEKPQESKYVG